MTDTRTENGVKIVRLIRFFLVNDLVLCYLLPVCGTVIKSFVESHKHCIVPDWIFMWSVGLMAAVRSTECTTHFTIMANRGILGILSVTNPGQVEAKEQIKLKGTIPCFYIYSFWNQSGKETFREFRHPSTARMCAK